MKKLCMEVSLVHVVLQVPSTVILEILVIN